jgi:hypothetical protein
MTLALWFPVVVSLAAHRLPGPPRVAAVTEVRVTWVVGSVAFIKAAVYMAVDGAARRRVGRLVEAVCPGAHPGRPAQPSIGTCRLAGLGLIGDSYVDIYAYRQSQWSNCRCSSIAVQQRAQYSGSSQLAYGRLLRTKPAAMSVCLSVSTSKDDYSVIFEDTSKIFIRSESLARRYTVV